MKKLCKILLLVTDVLLIPAAVFCHWLSGWMLLSDNPCIWTLLGGQCLTCGGTRFVHSLLSGQIGAAWHYNEFLFVSVIVALIVWVLIHVHLLTHARWAAKSLRILFSIPTLIVAVWMTVLFLLVRNWPMFILLWDIAKQNM